jgi:hypothetical protein
MAADDTGTILELYKTAVEMADRTSARRAGANSFFLTLNTALAAVVGIASSARKPPPQAKLPSFDGFGLVVVSVAGIVLALVWWLLLRYYRRLNAAKFQVINAMEERLPVKPFSDEWGVLHPTTRAEGGTSSRLTRWWRREVRHREATVVEQVIPFAFMGIYMALGLRALVQ